MTSIRDTDAVLIDWGTTNARAYLLARGEVRDRRRLPRGVKQVPPDGFAAALAELLGPFATPNAPILMSGMVGSRQGWIEVPYRPCPARLEDLAGHLHAVPGRPDVRIVSGVCRADADGTHHDVMRGEEVQVFGAMADDAPRAVLCLPGTHSKWVRYDDGRLVDFATAMTGEVFDVLRRHSLLAALLPSGDDGAAPADAAGAAFRHGLDRSAESGGLLHHLFGVRAEGLFGAIPAAGLAAYLSGMLIGHEILAMAQLFPSPDPVRLVAEGALADRYALAFAHLGRDCMAVDAEAATLRGLMRILERAAPLA